MTECSPFEIMRTTARAFEEWRQYMVEMCEDKKKNASNQQADEKGLDLMGMLRAFSFLSYNHFSRPAR
jgi:hypothetical protein